MLYCFSLLDNGSGKHLSSEKKYDYLDLIDDLLIFISQIKEEGELLQNISVSMESIATVNDFCYL